MSGARCIQRLDGPTRTPVGVGPVKVTIPRQAAAFTLRVVDSTNAPIAFTVAADGASAAFHFGADEAWSMDRLALAEDLVIDVDSANSTDVVELLIWREL